MSCLQFNLHCLDSQIKKKKKWGWVNRIVCSGYSNTRDLFNQCLYVFWIKHCIGLGSGTDLEKHSEDTSLQFILFYFFNLCSHLETKLPHLLFFSDTEQQMLLPLDVFVFPLGLYTVKNRRKVLQLLVFSVLLCPLRVTYCPLFVLFGSVLCACWHQM